MLFSPPVTKGEANAALNHIIGQFIARQTSASDTAAVKGAGDETQKTVNDFYKEVLEQQPFDAENLAKKKVRVMLDTKKPAGEMTLADYNMAKDRAIFKQAGYVILTDAEIQMAVAAIKSYGAVNRGSDGLDELRGIDNQPGAMLFQPIKQQSNTRNAPDKPYCSIRNTKPNNLTPITKKIKAKPIKCCLTRSG